MVKINQYFFTEMSFSTNQLFFDIITPVSVVIELRSEKIWKEKETKDKKEDEKFNKYDQPELFPDSHTAEPIIIK